MYEAFFGFRERPFQLTPDPRFLFLNASHREALATLRYGLASAPGITLLVGGAGTGKTTLLRAALQAERRPERQHVVLSNPTLSPADFFEILAEKFGLPHTSGSKGRFLLAFERDLLERHRTGGLTALVIDEAQSLSLDMFEEVRLLANLETETAKLVNVILVGQPELADRLNDASLRQFKQRVVLRCSLPPLDLESTAAYIASRLRVVGAVAGEVFTKEAVRAIYEASRGIPRTIGVVCENALLAGYSAQKKPIERAIVIDVCGGLDVPVNGGRAREDDAVPDEDVAAPTSPVPPERRAKAHFWSPSPRAESRPEVARVTDSEATVVRDRARIFDFF
jgi:general secretion pathway protein A